jgi:uncharacterized membrane protein
LLPFDVYRSRVRGLERNWFAQVFAPEPERTADWLQLLAADLRRPEFRLSLHQALSRRLRRNYGWMYLVLLLAWLLKTTAHGPSTTPNAGVVGSFGEWINHCQVGPFSGGPIIAMVAAFYAWLAIIGLRYRAEDVEARREYGEVYV